MHLESLPSAQPPVVPIGDAGIFLPPSRHHAPGWISDVLFFAADPIIITNKADEILFFNHAAEAMFGYRSAELESRDLEALIPGWPQQLAMSQLAHCAGRALDVVGLRRDGGRFNAEMSFATTMSRGAQIHILILRDTAMRKSTERALHDKLIAELSSSELALRELRHRMKNNFQLMLSMLRLERMHSISAEAITALQNMENRINALNGVDGELLLADQNQPVPLAPYIQRLAESLATALFHQSAPVAFHLSLDEIDVPAKTASNLGLLINEAVTNTFKHAVPAGATEITLTIARQNEDVILTIADNGPGPSPIQKSHIGGTELIRALTRQLGGAFERDVRQTGMRYVVRLPIP